MSQQNSIKFYRKKEKLSQGKLGAMIGVNHRTIHGYENKATVPDFQWPLLAKALKVPVDKLQARPPITYPVPGETSSEIAEAPAAEWLEFVEWLIVEMPLELLRQKREAAFAEKKDQFEDWIKILMRRRRDAGSDARKIAGTLFALSDQKAQSKPAKPG